MKKRWIAVLLCAALLAAFGWGQPRISGEGETYDLYFLEADLSDAPGGDALRAEPLYIESGEVRDTRELAEYLVTELLAGTGGRRPHQRHSRGDYPAVPGAGWYPGQGGPLLPLPVAFRRGAGLGRLCHHPDADPAAGDLRCQRDGPGPAAGLPRPADLHSQGCPVFQQRGCDRHAERHPVLSG